MVHARALSLFIATLSLTYLTYAYADNSAKNNQAPDGSAKQSQQTIQSGGLGKGLSGGLGEGLKGGLKGGLSGHIEKEQKSAKSAEGQQKAQGQNNPT